MNRKLLRIDDCHFNFPDRHGNYYTVDIKDSKVLCGGHWKEIKLYDDGSTDLIQVCRMFVNYASKQDRC